MFITEDSGTQPAATGAGRSAPESSSMVSAPDSRTLRIDSLGLSLRTGRVLMQQLGLVTLGDLTRIGASELLAQGCLGRLSVAEVRERLALHGLSLKDDQTEPASRAEMTPGALGVAALEWFRRFARDPHHHLDMPVWVLDLCPRTLAALAHGQIQTVHDLVGGTVDDLWLLALVDALSLDDAIHLVDDVEVRLRSFGLRLRTARPARAEFRLPPGGPEALVGYRLDEFRVSAETIVRLSSAGIRTLGDLSEWSDKAASAVETWPEVPRAQARALLALVEPRSTCPNPDPMEP
jgi:hypothetical protein